MTDGTRFRSRTTAPFRKCFAALPRHIQQQAELAYKAFRINPFHPGLRFKRVKGTAEPIYSARIGLRHRALCVLQDGVALWFWIGDHADYDQRIP